MMAQCPMIYAKFRILTRKLSDYLCGFNIHRNEMYYERIANDTKLIIDEFSFNI